MKTLRYIVLSLLTLAASNATAQDTLTFTGQVSAWANFNTENDLPLWMGGRYVPQAYYQIRQQGNNLIDFEASANLNAAIGTAPFDTCHAQTHAATYRVWARYSTNQWEVRAGLQKINFGSASLLRPLMWFDKVDPRDPLKLTNGVWGLLGRYYFLNNANLWLWVLHGNNETKTWEIGNTNASMPEWGGRIQLPVAKGEAALSYHFRQCHIDNLIIPAQPGHIPENRYGLDAKWDVGVGLWIEAAWIHKGRNIGRLTNQKMATAGIDYTFGIGNGLNITAEHLFIDNSQQPFEFGNRSALSGLSLGYPLGISSNLSVIVYVDHQNKNTYNLINLKKQFKYMSTYIMLYRTPKNDNLPLQGGKFNLLAGTGCQIMAVYNY